jgi:hypothetical protein
VVNVRARPVNRLSLSPLPGISRAFSENRGEDDTGFNLQCY